jgi:hypothetical protein
MLMRSFHSLLEWIEEHRGTTPMSKIGLPVYDGRHTRSDTRANEDLQMEVYHFSIFGGPRIRC